MRGAKLTANPLIYLHLKSSRLIADYGEEHAKCYQRDGGIGDLTGTPPMSRKILHSRLNLYLDIA